MTKRKRAPYIHGPMHYVDLTPLRNNNWEWEFTTSQYGLWIDPITRQKYRTEEALKIQESRK